MNLRLSTCLLIWCLPHGLADVAMATNTSFLPGDAFFHTELGMDELDRLATESSPVFGYVRPSQMQPNLCGFAGFAHLKYENMPQPLRENLVKLARHLRLMGHPARFERRVNPETGESEDIEINPLHLFIYNPTTTGRIGLKYNEHWHRHTARFETFVPDSEMIGLEWRDSERVAGLEVEVPFELVGGKKPADAERLKGGFFGRSQSSVPIGGPPIEEPVLIHGPKKCIVIPASDRTLWIGTGRPKPQRELIDVARKRNGATIYIVTADGIVGQRIRRGKWTEFDPFHEFDETPLP